MGRTSPLLRIAKGEVGPGHHPTTFGTGQQSAAPHRHQPGRSGGLRGQPGRVRKVEQRAAVRPLELLDGSVEGAEHLADGRPLHHGEPRHVCHRGRPELRQVAQPVAPPPVAWGPVPAATEVAASGRPATGRPSGQLLKCGVFWGNSGDMISERRARHAAWTAGTALHPRPPRLPDRRRAALAAAGDRDGLAALRPTRRRRIRGGRGFCRWKCLPDQACSGLIRKASRSGPHGSQQASSACARNSERLMAFPSAHHCPGDKPSTSARVNQATPL